MFTVVTDVTHTHTRTRAQKHAHTHSLTHSHLAYPHFYQCYYASCL